jgi:hypothetical protein
LLCCSLFYAVFVEFSLGVADRATTENELNFVDLYYSFILYIPLHLMDPRDKVKEA